MRICDNCGATLDAGEICECQLFRVILLRSDGTKYLLVIDGELKTLQSLVGGHIEHVPMCDDAGLLVNEDGIALGLKPNPFFNGALIGDIIVIGEPKDGGDSFTSLPEYTANELFKIFGEKETLPC